MQLQNAEQIINAAFDDIAGISTETTGDVRDAVNAALDALDAGTARVAEKNGADWQVNQWLKKAVLLSFRLNDMTTHAGGPQGSSWWDKVPSKFDGWDASRFADAGFRAVPNCIVRRHLGHRWLLRANRQGCAYFGRRRYWRCPRTTTSRPGHY